MRVVKIFLTAAFWVAVITVVAQGQVTIASQDFEAPTGPPKLQFTVTAGTTVNRTGQNPNPGQPNLSFAAEGNAGTALTVTNSTATVLFDNVSIFSSFTN